MWEEKKEHCLSFFLRRWSESGIGGKLKKVRAKVNWNPNVMRKVKQKVKKRMKRKEEK